MSSAEPLPFPGPAAGTPGERLAAAAASLAGRLADLLQQALPGPEHAAARDFLRAMAGEPAAVPGPGGDPFDRVVEGFGLSAVEADLLVLAGLSEEHEGYAGVLRTLHPRGEPRPTTGLAAQLLCGSAAERRLLREVLETGPAARAGVLRLGEEGPFWERTLHPADALWSVLHGADAWPEAVRPARGPVALAGLDAWLAGPAARLALAALADAGPRTLLVSAHSEELAMQRGAALVAAAGGEPLRVLLPAAPSPELERLVSVHAVARGAVPVLRVAAPEGPGAPQAPEMAGHPGPVVVCARTGGVVARGPRPVLEVAAAPLTPSARADMWRGLLPEAAGHAEALAARYTVEPETAAAAAGDARSLAALEGRAPGAEDVARGVRTRAGLALSSGVRLLRPTAAWEQLVLPGGRRTQLREALDRLRYQARVLDEWGFLAGRPGARGVRMLFSGPSGTGKTLSAEVMAAELGVDLLLVDISRVVSKWIGETEKEPVRGLRRGRERPGRALLRRGRRAVRQAHRGVRRPRPLRQPGDRLPAHPAGALRGPRRPVHQPAPEHRPRLPAQAGVPAGVRGARPGGADRALAVPPPPGAPLEADVDLAEIAAHYPVVGGFIRNAAVAAGFLAAAEGSPITRRHVVRAIRREYDKTGRAFPGLPAGMAAP